MTSNAHTAGLQPFNVLDYGARGDGKTDNTEAFSRCLKSVFEAGGGRMYLPAGLYRGRILIPAVEAPERITIEIVGESNPVFLFGTVGRHEMRNHNTIIENTSTSGPAVIYAIPPDFKTNKFSPIHIIIKDIEVRTYSNPRINGIDLERASQCRIENVMVDTGVYNVQEVEPTHGTKGIITPAINNGAFTVLRNVVVTGYHTGILVNEHTAGDNIVVASNINGLEFTRAYHASYFGRVGAYRCTNTLTVKGKHAFSIAQLNIEHAGPGQTDATTQWQKTIYDINDPDNLGIADINYWVVLGNVGESEVFTRNGGAYIRARRIGSA